MNVQVFLTDTKNGIAMRYLLKTSIHLDNVIRMVGLPCLGTHIEIIEEDLRIGFKDNIERDGDVFEIEDIFIKKTHISIFIKPSI